MQYTMNSQLTLILDHFRYEGNLYYDPEDDKTPFHTYGNVKVLSALPKVEHGQKLYERIDQFILNHRDQLDPKSLNTLTTAIETKIQELRNYTTRFFPYYCSKIWDVYGCQNMVKCVLQLETILKTIDLTCPQKDDSSLLSRSISVFSLTSSSSDLSISDEDKTDLSQSMCINSNVPPPPLSTSSKVKPKPLKFEGELEVPSFDRIQYKSLDKEKIETQILTISDYIMGMKVIFDPKVRLACEIDEKFKSFSDTLKNIKELSSLISKSCSNITKLTSPNPNGISILEISYKNSKERVPFYTDELKKLLDEHNFKVYNSQISSDAIQKQSKILKSFFSEYLFEVENCNNDIKNICKISSEIKLENEKKLTLSGFDIEQQFKTINISMGKIAKLHEQINHNCIQVSEYFLSKVDAGDSQIKELNSKISEITQSNICFFHDLKEESTKYISDKTKIFLTIQGAKKELDDLIQLKSKTIESWMTSLKSREDFISGKSKEILHKPIEMIEEKDNPVYKKIPELKELKELTQPTIIMLKKNDGDGLALHHSFLKE